MPLVKELAMQIESVAALTKIVRATEDCIQGVGYGSNAGDGR